jgi:hypothetical protein
LSSEERKKKQMNEHGWKVRRGELSGTASPWRQVPVFVGHIFVRSDESNDCFSADVGLQRLAENYSL